MITHLLKSCVDEWALQEYNSSWNTANSVLAVSADGQDIMRAIQLYELASWDWLKTLWPWCDRGQTNVSHCLTLCACVYWYVCVIAACD